MTNIACRSEPDTNGRLTRVAIVKLGRIPAEPPTTLERVCICLNALAVTHYLDRRLSVDGLYLRIMTRSLLFLALFALRAAAAPLTIPTYFDAAPPAAPREGQVALGPDPHFTTEGGFGWSKRRYRGERLPSPWADAEPGFFGKRGVGCSARHRAGLIPREI